MTNPSANIDAVLASFEERWSPRILTRVNDYDVRLAKVEGTFVWHSHPDTDELFVVLDGSLDIRLRQPGTESADPGTGTTETVVHLGRHDVFVVPRGVEHCPASADGAAVMLLEPTGTLSTGDYAGDVPDHITSTTGLPW
ncbi:mannose-6-phosphate isomerase-like protein (cupin superfamily) [Prauserella isguenensis]|uniref:Mannose-6-phosphate isomerase-like protein (Cupin superfamily) n=1 Tax=Prauserella isguenensis TaxID=1470180 RepID=A0A839S345_9PSEU|nr:cupin domain-containing protein [Prauserella isguenensis]MBB3051724.1 mannose-6-phosphate isomerase-like protein (cupin superfamily) [Prauserella isguenensis]